MRILLAEDQTVERRLLEASLRQAGHTVEAFADGSTAWRRFEQQPARLVISDWMMPELDGLELIRRIRAAGLPRHTYTILLTSRGATTDVLDGLAAGADDYLTKPVDHRELAARVAIGERMIHLEDSLLASQERLHRLATYDGLTGLFNRQALLDRAAAALRRARRSGTPLGAILIDVDHFKQVNDAAGHLLGDEVLKGVANAMREVTGPDDLVGRWGGEEFLVVLPKAGAEEAIRVAERIRQAVGERRVPAGPSPPLRVEISAGVAACIPDAQVDIDALFKAADDALLGAKRSGRNRVALAGPLSGLRQTA